MLKLKRALSRKYIHFHLLLADRSTPIDYFKLLLPKERTIELCVKKKMLAFHHVMLDH